jgi:hypothetical protein
MKGSQFTTYMSMVNLCDLLGAFVSGHLQSYFRANVIGLGCAVMIICAFVIVSLGVWYDRRCTSSMEANTKKAETKNEILLRDCWPIRICTKYRRGSFKMIV